MEKRGCEINNKRTVQAVGEGAVGRWRAADETFRNGCKSTGKRKDVGRKGQRAKRGNKCLKCFALLDRITRMFICKKVEFSWHVHSRETTV